MKKTLKSMFPNVLEYIAHLDLPDPRVQGRCSHPLIEIISIAFCAILCRAESFAEIERFGWEKYEWFRLRLGLPLKNGIPSHDTFSRVLGLIHPKVMEWAFSRWTNWVQLTDPFRSKPLRLCIDGKVLKGTERTVRQPEHPLALVNVYCHDHGVVLGQTESASTGTSETRAAVRCLKLMNPSLLKKALISVDAACSFKSMTNQIRALDAHYLIPIKGNRQDYLSEIEDIFQKNLNQKGIPLEFAESDEISHGRRERRECILIPAKEQISERFSKAWKDVQSLIQITRIRTSKDRRTHIRKAEQVVPNPNYLKDRVQTHVHYYISSKKFSAKQALSQIRTHWEIENQLNWILDVSFGEDSCRVRNKAAARNLSLLRKLAFNLIKKDPFKASVRIKMKRAGWNQQYLEKLIGMPHF